MKQTLFSREDQPWPFIKLRKKIISFSVLLMAHLGYNNWSPGERLQNSEVNDKTLRMGIKEKAKKEKKICQKE